MDGKLMTIVVPAYNVENYIRRCLGSLVTAGSDAEVIVVNDGSTDNTEMIANEYAVLYPDIVKVVTKENGGHGSTINTGLRLATGRYFYTVDADDWLEVGALEKLMRTMREVVSAGTEVDLFIVNYIYDQFEENKRHTIQYRNVFPKMQVFEWKDTKIFNPVQFIMLHATIHKTDILRSTGIELPEHTFYVDNILVYNALPYFRKMYYIDIDLYKYYIGRADQSVNYDNMIKRIDQYIRVIKIMIEAHHLDDIEDDKLRRYMYSYLAAIYTIVNTFLTLSKKRENLDKKEELRVFLKNFDKRMYRRLKLNPLSAGSSVMDGKAGRFILRSSYRIGRKIFKYN
ncbi:MAG: glycosyltransferase family 2 protein [Eubacteriales bacterium]|nr:glycosyltransferase family 2 protein [Eubacteriales bacterium]MDD4326817.1 glycosyltransferase family 2 protein [Eubacteriales bacterium]MDD4717870.1 glycosyltransferase family 2 protein [Eubacteriales bacterium]